MTDSSAHQPAGGPRTFTWHPDYRGQEADAVVRDLKHQIESDQRAYELTLSGAEKEEHAALASVMELEKRWSTFSFDWADMPSEELARRIVDFELERDRRQEMISWEQYRDEVSPPPAATGGWRASLSDEDRRRYANCGAIVLMAVILLAIIVLAQVLL